MRYQTSLRLFRPLTACRCWLGCGTYCGLSLISVVDFLLRCCPSEAYDSGMRWVLGSIVMALLVFETGGTVKSARMNYAVAPATVSTPTAAKARVDFDTQLKPLFQAKCMPCHFSGGQMYDRLPFDKPATIRKLGTKLFTRIKEEHDRRLIEDFLTQSP